MRVERGIADRSAQEAMLSPFFPGLKAPVIREVIASTTVGHATALSDALTSKRNTQTQEDNLWLHIHQGVHLRLCQ